VVNIAVGKKGAIAIRRLYSSDIVITFRNGIKGYYTENID